MFLIFLIFLPKLLSLYIFETHSKPSLIRELPQIFIQPNQTQKLNLNDYFIGFNLTFFFNELNDPYLDYSYQSALSFTSKKSFQAGFYKVFFNQPLFDSYNISSQDGVILANPNLIYSVSFIPIKEDFDFPVNDFLNLPSNISCGNVFLLNKSFALLDCYNSSSLEQNFLTVSLDMSHKFLRNTIVLNKFANAFPNNTELSDIYIKCSKELRYLNGILLRYCSENVMVSKIVEVFWIDEYGEIEKTQIIDKTSFEIELYIVDITIYQVFTKENFSFFYLDEIMGPCSIKIENKSFILLNDFPDILGDKKFSIQYIKESFLIIVASSHYISEISIDINKNDSKKLQKRINFGKDYTEIKAVQFTRSSYFVHMINKNTKSLAIFNRNSENTDLIYKIPLSNDIFSYFNLMSKKMLFLYDNFSKQYRVLSFDSNVLKLSCCEGDIPASYFPYNRTLQFTIDGCNEKTGKITQITAKILICLTNTSIATDDSMGFRLFNLNPKIFTLDNVFFFNTKEKPNVLRTNMNLGTCSNQDYFNIGTQLNKPNFSICSLETIENKTLLSLKQILETALTLPLLSIKNLTISYRNKLEGIYHNPLVLGFLNLEFMSTVIDNKLNINKNYSENQSFRIISKPIGISDSLTIDLTPDLSNIAIQFNEDFLDNLPNNITTFDLNHQDSLNLDGFFNGLIESYEFELSNDSYANISSFYIDPFVKRINNYYDFKLNNIKKVLFNQEFAFILMDTELLMVGMPPIYANFTKIASIPLKNLSTLFDSCYDVFLHQNQEIIFILCQSLSKPNFPKRLIFLRYSKLGFGNILKQTPLQQYIELIKNMIFIENVMLVIENLADSLNESFIHVYILDNFLLMEWKNNQNFFNYTYIVKDIAFINYKVMNAETFDVDYLILKNLQVKVLGHMGDLLVLGVLMSDFSGLYYTEFLINASNISNTNTFIGNVKALQRVPLSEILGNYSHDVNLQNQFLWVANDDFGRLMLILYNSFNLIEVTFSRFDWEGRIISREYQSLYGCFHEGMIESNDKFMIEMCSIQRSLDSDQVKAEIFLQFYVKTEKNFSIISQMLSFQQGEILNYFLNEDFLSIAFKNGSFISYKLKVGISLENPQKIIGNDILNGIFTAKNRYSQVKTWIKLRPKIIINERFNFEFYLLIVLPIIITAIGLAGILIVIRLSRNKRRDEFVKTFSAKSLMKESILGTIMKT